MTCRILSPDKIETFADVRAVSVPGFKGAIQVMSHHAELFELLRKGPVRITENNGSSKEFLIKSGACRFADNTLTIISSGKADVKN